MSQPVAHRKSLQSRTKDTSSAKMPPNHKAAPVEESAEATTEFELKLGNHPPQVQRVVASLHQTPNEVARQAIFRSLQRKYGNQYATTVARTYRQSQTAPVIMRSVALESEEQTKPKTQPAPILVVSPSTVSRVPDLAPTIVAREGENEEQPQEKSLGQKILGGIKKVGLMVLEKLFGPIYKLIKYFIDKKQNPDKAGLFQTSKEYIGMLKKGAIDPFGGGVKGVFATGLSFFANSILDNISYFSAWLAFITGLLGLIPGAQPLLGVSGILGTIATLSNLGKAGINALLSVWTGVYAAHLYKNLPATFDTPDGKKQLDQYIVTLTQFGVNVKEMATGLQDLGVAVVTGGIGGAISGPGVGKGITDKLSGSYDVSQGFASGKDAVYGNYGTNDNGSLKSLADTRADLGKDTAKDLGKEGVSNFVEGYNGKEEEKTKPVYTAKSQLPTPWTQFKASVLEGLSFITGMISAFQKVKAMVAMVVQACTWIKNKIMDKINSLREAEVNPDDVNQEADSTSDQVTQGLDTSLDVLDSTNLGLEQVKEVLNTK